MKPGNELHAAGKSQLGHPLQNTLNNSPLGLFAKLNSWAGAYSVEGLLEALCILELWQFPQRLT